MEMSSASSSRNMNSTRMYLFAIHLQLQSFLVQVSGFPASGQSYSHLIYVVWVLSTKVLITSMQNHRSPSSCGSAAVKSDVE